MMKALLIHHKGAGDDSHSRKALTRMLEAAGWKVEYLARKHADAKAVARHEPDLVAVAGGDGTVASVLRMLPDRAVPIAILPTGSANNIARALGIHGDPERLVACWDLKRRVRMDLGNAHGPWGCRPFAEAVGFGAFADSLRVAIDADGPEKIRAGRRAFAETLRAAAALPIEVEVDGEAVPDGLLLAEAMNVPVTGPWLRLAPDADPGDGRLHLAFLRPEAREALCAWLDGDGEAQLPVEQRAGREVTFRGGGATMRIDDCCRRLDPGSDVVVRLEGAPVQILAPPQGPALAG